MYLFLISLLAHVFPSLTSCPNIWRRVNILKLLILLIVSVLLSFLLNLDVSGTPIVKHPQFAYGGTFLSLSYVLAVIPPYTQQAYYQFNGTTDGYLQ